MTSLTSPTKLVAIPRWTQDFLDFTSLITGWRDRDVLLGSFQEERIAVVSLGSRIITIIIL